MKLQATWSVMLVINDSQPELVDVKLDVKPFKRMREFGISFIVIITTCCKIKNRKNIYISHIRTT